jgi:hypothetical protein
LAFEASGHVSSEQDGGRRLYCLEPFFYVGWLPRLQVSWPEHWEVFGFKPTTFFFRVGHFLSCLSFLGLCSTWLLQNLPVGFARNDVLILLNIISL